MANDDNRDHEPRPAFEPDAERGGMTIPRFSATITLPAPGRGPR